MKASIVVGSKREGGRLMLLSAVDVEGFAGGANEYWWNDKGRAPKAFTDLVDTARRHMDDAFNRSLQSGALRATGDDVKPPRGSDLEWCRTVEFDREDIGAFWSAAFAVGGALAGTINDVGVQLDAQKFAAQMPDGDAEVRAE